MTEATPRSDARALTIILLTGPVLWSIYHLIVYGLVEVACRAGWLGTRMLGITLLSWVIAGVTLATIVAIIVATGPAYREWRRPDADEGDRLGTTVRFLAFGAVLVNPLFALATLLDGIPALLLPPCA